MLGFIMLGHVAVRKRDINIGMISFLHGVLRRVDTASQPFSNADMTQSVGCDLGGYSFGVENIMLSDRFRKEPVKILLCDNSIFQDIAAQLAERQTEDLRVPGLITGESTIYGRMSESGQ